MTEPTTSDESIRPATPAGETLLRAFLEASPDAVVVADQAGRIVVLNHLAETMFGYDRGELLGSSIEALIPDRYRRAHCEYRAEYNAQPEVRPMGKRRTLRAQRKDGTEFSVEISLSPIVTERGTLIASIVRDVTERLHSEAKFRGFIEAAPDAVVVVDQRGEIVLVNNLTERMFGYPREDLLGQKVELLVPDRFRAIHTSHRANYMAEARTRPMGEGRELYGRRRTGEEFSVEISLSPVETEQGMLVISIVRDTTERRRADEALKASLREKEVLLREIHHRVKNNLQVTSSLLRLQSTFTQDKRAKEMFRESQDRIRSMALVHEKLYQARDLSRVDLSDYIQSLAQLLFRSFGASRDRVTFSIHGDPVFLSVEAAVPCGLIVNELLSNCLKHAFPEGRSGKVEVDITMQSGHRFTLSVRDDGVGLPDNVVFDKAETLGLQLVRTLAEQLHAEVELLRVHGTDFRIHIPEQQKV